MVTFVALLMFLQLGVTPAVATTLSALLFLPWVLKSFMRAWVGRAGHPRLQLHVSEYLLGAALVVLALAFPVGWRAVFWSLMLVGLLCVWHELAAGMYYERMLRPAFQRVLAGPRMASAQAAVVMTYGALIFLVGMLQVYFRQIRYSWSVGCYVTAGVFLLFAFMHLLSLRTHPVPGARTAAMHEPAASPFAGGRERIRSIGRGYLLLLLLLLPQSLMFHARVLYLYDAPTQGGLGCTIQEIGFAQGTVGVLAFSLGLVYGRYLIGHLRRRQVSMRRVWQQLFWPLAIVLGLSPLVYLCMTVWPPQSLLPLCCGTMAAQLLFGLGIGICRQPLRTVSGLRYRSRMNMLQIPLIAAAMIVPMALSGWLVELLGYHRFFLVNALSAPVCLAAVWWLRRNLK